MPVVELQVAAARLGTWPPENEEDQAAANGLIFEEQQKGTGSDSAAAARGAQVSDAKAFATLQARAALAGFELARMADGTFVIARWTMTRALHDMAAVTAFLAQAGSDK